MGDGGWGLDRASRFCRRDQMACSKKGANSIDLPSFDTQNHSVGTEGFSNYFR